MRTRSAVRTADLIIAQTDDQAIAIRRSLGSRVRVEVCPSFGPEMSATKDGPRDTILWVGANKPVKRPAQFLEIARHGPESFRYVMVGKELDPDWAGAAPVHLVGSMSPGELVRVYQKSHVLVYPSSVEGFPNTFLEAWSCGTPVVSVGLDPGGVISAHGLGWVCEDAAGAARILCDTQGRDGIGDDMRTRCREYVARHHSRDHVLELHLGLFAGLVRPPVGEAR
jgi:glycosyltransferase involved in cell wall biosynthesis